MSETDEGSQGFEMLDEESPIDNSKAVPESSQPKVPPAPPSQLPIQAADKAPSEGVAQAITGAPVSQTSPVSGDGQTDPATPPATPLNADIMWNGLQWGVSMLSKVTEKAKIHVDKAITILDPQMKPLIYSGGDLSVIVASDKSDKVMPIQDAFWDVFGRATVDGVKAQPSNMAAQPVGFTAGLKAAEDRVLCLRQSYDVVEESPIVAVEGFLTELSTGAWYDMSCIYLEDKANNINIHVYTQATPIKEIWINEIKDSTPADYPLSWSGFDKTIGEVAGKSLNCERNEWHEKWTGLPRSAMIYSAAKSLAFMYKQHLEELSQQVEAGVAAEPAIEQTAPSVAAAPSNP